MTRTTLLMEKVTLLPPHLLTFLIFSQGDYHGQDAHPPTDYNNKHPDQTVEITHEEQKKSWMDLSDERKHQLKVRIFSEVFASISRYPRWVVAF